MSARTAGWLCAGDKVIAWTAVHAAFIAISAADRLALSGTIDRICASCASVNKAGDCVAGVEVTFDVSTEVLGIAEGTFPVVCYCKRAIKVCLRRLLPRITTKARNTVIIPRSRSSLATLISLLYIC
jgi:hypothetical protein